MDIQFMDIQAAQEAEQLLEYAYYCLNRGELAEAEEAAQEARDLFDELRVVAGSAQSRWLLGFIQYSYGEYKAALPLLASAQQQFASVGLTRQQCATLYLLAHCHLGLARPSKAIYSLKLAKTALQSHNEESIPLQTGNNRFLPDIKTLTELITGLLLELEQEQQGEDRE
ncbi:MAG: hypothetical protein AB1489_26595 [Acidobacteriota bacterium]